jgi:hypothetical protein
MYDQTDYFVDSRSNEELRRIVQTHRARLDPDRKGEIDIVKILSSGSIDTVKSRKTLILIPLADEELGKDDAISVSEKTVATLRVKNSVLRAAKDRTETAAHRRAIFTLIHEYFHIVLCHDRAPMARATGVSTAASRPSFIPAYRSAEHQANYATAILLIDPDLAHEYQTAAEIRLRFNVNLRTAEIFVEERARLQKSPAVAGMLWQLSRSIGKSNQSESQTFGSGLESDDKIICTVCGRVGGCNRSIRCKHRSVSVTLQDGDPLMDLEF